ncbi:MAG: hypothetical protein WD075_06240 [Rhodospirillales bacterium]
MTLIFQRCVVCGFERQNAPSALPTCCNKKMRVVSEKEVGLGRKPVQIAPISAQDFVDIHQMTRQRKDRLDPVAALRVQLSYSLPEVHKLGHCDEIL